MDRPTALPSQTLDSDYRSTHTNHSHHRLMSVIGQELVFISFSFRPQLLDVIGSVVTLSSVHQTALEIIGSNSELHERYLWALGQQTRPSSEVAESKLSESRVGEIPPAVDRSSRKSQAGFFGQTPRAGFSEWMTTLVESKCFLSELVINFSSDARLMSQLLVT